MRILFVEDNGAFADTVTDELRARSADISIDLVGNKSDAGNTLAANYYDLIILDLSIPSSPDGLDKDVANGQAIFYEAQRLAPGTPVYILTGSDPDPFSLGLSRHGEKLDLWGSNKLMPTILYFPKDKTNELIDEVLNVSTEVKTVNAITINTRGKHIPLSAEQKRALRVFVRSNGGTSCTIYRLGGLSGSLVAKVNVVDERGNTTGLCVAKLGDMEKLRKERDSFERHVKFIKMHAFAPLVACIDKGLKSQGAIFYSLAEDYEDTFFSVLAKAPAEATGIVKQVREGLQRWSDARQANNVLIAEIRRRVLTDEALVKIREEFDLPFIEDVEKRSVTAATSCIHGDLHGGNILVSEKMVPVLIDFGDVGQGFTCLDPITLEMSILFHPDAEALGLSSTVKDVVEHWPNIERYISDNPLAFMIQACRDWAHDLGGDDDAVLAAGYSFALRQLKYKSVDPSITIKLLSSVAHQLLARVD